MKEHDSIFGDAIYSYSRRQAIADGVLVDLCKIVPFRRAFKYHVACTSAVWDIIEAAITKEHQDLSGIAHDICTMALLTIQLATDPSLIRFKVSIAGNTHTFKLHIGPGDEAEPVLTLMFPNED